MSDRFVASLPTFLYACALAAGHVDAQTCAVPWAITANTPTAFDTCQGDSSLVLACGVLPLAGRAAVVGLTLRYPAGSLSIQSLDADYEPAAFLLNAHCDDDAPCSAVAWAVPGQVATIELSALDSGTYFLVVAAEANAQGAACGHVLVTANVTPEQQALFGDGVFRSGIAPLWPP